MSLWGKLILDIWYKTLMYIGGVGSLLSLFLPLQIQSLSNMQIFILFFGIFLLGLGEWKNHPAAVQVEPVSMMKALVMQGVMRVPNRTGNIIILVGIMLIIIVISTVLGWLPKPI